MSPRKAPGHAIPPLIVRTSADAIGAIRQVRGVATRDQIEDRAANWVSRAKIAERAGKPLTAESHLDRAAEALSAANLRPGP